MLLAWTPFAQELKDIEFSIRAKQNLLRSYERTFAL